MKKIAIILLTISIISSITTIVCAETSKFISISAGADHYLILKDDGTVWAWGKNDYGQLGVGNREPLSAPTRIDTIDGIIKVCAGYQYSIALKKDGSVWTWGKNYVGALGDGTPDNSLVPVKIIGGDSVVDISAGGQHSLAVGRNGNLRTWGMNNYGQLGIKNFTYKFTYPQHVKKSFGEGEIFDARCVSANINMSMMLKTDGTVWTFGDSTQGQAGNGEITFGNGSLVEAKGLKDIIAISAGGYHAAALDKDGSVYLWGGNNFGQLGKVSDNVATPEKVNNFTNIIAISAGMGRTILVDSKGDVWNCGYNREGQLADGTNINKFEFIKVSGLSDVTAVSAGGDGSLALEKDGTVWIWNNNQVKQMQESDYVPTKDPVDNTNDITKKVPNVDETTYQNIPWEYAVEGGNTGEIIFANKQYISVGVQGIKISTDLKSWKTVNKTSYNSIAYNGNTFVAVGERVPMATSTNAINWTTNSNPNTNGIETIIWDGKRFVAAGAGTIIISDDGFNWANKSVDYDGSFRGIAYNGNMYVLTGWWGGIICSTDLENWDSVEFNGYFLTPGTIRWLKDRFVVTGGGGAIYSSFDGMHWSKAKQQWDNWMQSCAYNGKIFIAVGMDATIYVSLDGDYWICKTEWNDTKNSYNDIIWTGEKFVILGRDHNLSWDPDDIIKVKVNDSYLIMDTAPVTSQDRTLVPVRVISEALGAQVDWSDVKQTVTITLNGNIIEIKPYDTNVAVNDEILQLDIPAQMIDNRTFLPLRFVVENLNATVTWDEDAKTISINSNHKA